MVKHRNRLGRIGPVLVVVGGLLYAAPAAAREDDPWARLEWENAGKRFVLGVGFIYARFDTNAKFTDKGTNLSIFVDAEGSLGLPETDAVPLVYGGYTFSPRHGITFSSWRIRREKVFIDQEINLENGRLVGSAELRDDTKFYNIAYSNMLFHDKRSRVSLRLGIEALDIRYSLEGFGEITIDGVTEDVVLDESANVFAPLPLVGFDFWMAFTPKWSLSPKIGFVAGSYQDVTATVVHTSVFTRYQFTRRLGLLLGISYFLADVKIDEKDELVEVFYGYNGAFLGLHVVF